MELHQFDDLLRAQEGVISRRQVRARYPEDERAAADHDLARLVRRRELRRVHEGVYVDHTGPLTDEQRAWAAVLVHWPAVLCGTWSLVLSGMRGVSLAPKVEIAVAHGRRVDPAEGVVVRRVRGLDEVARWGLSPPRTRLEHAVLEVASHAVREDAAVAAVADACQSRRTTPERLGRMLDRLPNLPRRALLREVLEDTSAGALSALERRYLRQVERAHGLPDATRQPQAVVAGGTAYRDVVYRPWDVVVELDGRLGHEWSLDMWDDLERDVDTAVSGGLTIRAGWRQVLESCRLAGAVAAILRARGWTGDVTPCGPGCRAVDRGGSQAPGAGDPPQLASQ